MAHYAEIDSDNKVSRVIVVSNDVMLDENGFESEEIGAEFCKNLFGGRWIQTSYNGKIRKNFASAGDSYDESKDAFIPQKGFDSWILNPETCKWEPPIPYPTDGKNYIWNELAVSWLEV